MPGLYVPGRIDAGFGLADLGVDDKSATRAQLRRRWLREQLHDPDSATRQLWGSVVLLAIVYHAVHVPVTVAFLPPWRRYLVDWACDATLALDCALEAAAFGFVADGQLHANAGASSGAIASAGSR